MILDEIVADTRLRLARRQAQRPAETLRAEGAARPPALSLVAALAAPGVSVIAEIKRPRPRAAR
jgi:indole-3-glycerol phosphate synthase